MFNKEYVFYGKHADYVKKLTAKCMISDKESTSIFIRNMDVLLFASIVGIVYGKAAPIDKTIIDKGGKVLNTKVFAETMISESENISYNYETVMLLHNKNCDDIDTRLERAFKYHNKSEEYKKECFNIFNGYVLGGIETLYEKIMGEAVEIEEYMENLYDFLDEFNVKYNLIDGSEEISELYSGFNR